MELMDTLCKHTIENWKLDNGVLRPHLIDFILIWSFSLQILPDLSVYILNNRMMEVELA